MNFLGWKYALTDEKGTQTIADMKEMCWRLFENIEDDDNSISSGGFVLEKFEDELYLYFVPVMKNSEFYGE
jgi:hypothetical protein